MVSVIWSETSLSQWKVCTILLEKVEGVNLKSAFFSLESNLWSIRNLSLFITEMSHFRRPSIICSVILWFSRADQVGKRLTATLDQIARNYFLLLLDQHTSVFLTALAVPLVLLLLLNLHFIPLLWLTSSCPFSQGIFFLVLKHHEGIVNVPSARIPSLIHLQLQSLRIKSFVAV